MQFSYFSCLGRVRIKANWIPKVSSYRIVDCKMRCENGAIDGRLQGGFLWLILKDINAPAPLSHAQSEVCLIMPPI